LFFRVQTILNVAQLVKENLGRYLNLVGEKLVNQRFQFRASAKHESRFSGIGSVNFFNGKFEGECGDQGEVAGQIMG